MNSLVATVQAIENERITLVFEDGQTIVVPASMCEGMVKVGEQARLIVTAPTAEDAGRQALARELLNEILHV